MEMTRAEFYQKYGDVEVEFSSYYKYVFIYKAILPDGSVLSCGYGGNHDDIYRHDVIVGAKEKISSLCPYQGSTAKNGIEIDSFYDY